MRLGNVFEGLGGVLRPTQSVLEGFESRLRVPKAGPGVVLTAFGDVFARFFGVPWRWQAKIENS